MQSSQRLHEDSLQSNNQQSQRVEIYFSAEGFTSSSKILLEVYLSAPDEPAKIVLKTKPMAIGNQRIPFANSLLLQYFFEVRQKLVIRVWAADWQRQLIGVAQASLAEVFNGREKGIIKNVLKQKDIKGQIHLICQKNDDSRQLCSFELVSHNVEVAPTFLCFGQGNCFWRLYKRNRHQQLLVYESQLKQGGNNTFNTVKINYKKLCDNDANKPIVIKFFNQNNNNPIGETVFTLTDLKSKFIKYTLTRDNKQKGRITLLNLTQIIKYSYLDYIQNGMQLSMMACIDFTASNQLPRFPTSLHNFAQNKQSLYELALQQVSNIILEYSKQKLVPVYGFGAKVKFPNMEKDFGKLTHHCFPLNGSCQNPFVFGAAGIKKALRQNIQHLQFSGPTLFAPLLRQAMKQSRQMKETTTRYLVLLIITDGSIHDKQEVMDLLVDCGRLPLSVIIVGIGNNEQNWSIMHELDDDECQMVNLQGKKTERDLVQFVQFSKHNNDSVKLAREVLQQLPRQIQEYNSLVGLTPLSYKKQAIYYVNDIEKQKIGNIQSNLASNPPANNPPNNLANNPPNIPENKPPNNPENNPPNNPENNLPNFPANNPPNIPENNSTNLPANNQ